MRTIILDRNPSILSWLEYKGIQGEHVSNVTFRDALNNHVYGPCPLGLASVAAQVSLVRMPRLESEDHRRYMNGALTPEQMEALGAHIRTYTVRQVAGPGFAD